MAIRVIYGRVLPLGCSGEQSKAKCLQRLLKCRRPLLWPLPLVLRLSDGWSCKQVPLVRKILSKKWTLVLNRIAKITDMTNIKGGEKLSGFFFLFLLWFGLYMVEGPLINVPSNQWVHVQCQCWSDLGLKASETRCETCICISGMRQKSVTLSAEFTVADFVSILWVFSHGWENKFCPS